MLTQRIGAMQAAGFCRDLGPMNLRTAQTMLAAAYQNLGMAEILSAFCGRTWTSGRWRGWGGPIHAVGEDLKEWLCKTCWPHTQPVWPRQTESVSIAEPPSNAECAETLEMVRREAEDRGEEDRHRLRIAEAMGLLERPKPVCAFVAVGAMTPGEAEELYQKQLQIDAEAREEARKMLAETGAP